MKKKTYPFISAGKKQQFARSVVAGDLVFLSGTTGRILETGEILTEDLDGQMRAALDKIRTALTEAGTSMDNLIKLTTYLKNKDDYEPMRQIEKEYWQKFAPRLLEEPPASTVIQAISLTHPKILVVIDAIAFISR
jgi:2-iminobutanoate/2-iminopropanoate deaminase